MKKVPLFQIFNDDDDVRAVTEVIRSGRDWSSGKIIGDLEREIASYVGTKHCVTFGSGGSALHSTMLALGIGKGDDVLVPSFTFIATAYAPLYTGAMPRFVDIERERMGLDPSDIKRKLTSETKAVLPIHHGGTPCLIEEIAEELDGTGVDLVEDAAEAFGSKTKGRKLGTFGRVSVFSFCQNKIFTTGEGGCVVTDDQEVADTLRLMCSYGRVSKGDYFNTDAPVDYVMPGSNWRLSSIQAALGLSQLKKVDRLIAMRRKVADAYCQELDGAKDIEAPVEGDWFDVHQMFTVRLKNKKLRDGLIDHLTKNGVACKVYFHLVHEYTVFKGCHAEGLEVSQDLSGKVLSLPIYPSMNDEDISYVCQTIKEYLRGA
ncbi:MAG TPA: DegT/DnrJ/EryC1/StrS family aminotransferase [Methanomassiliicoccales archaeon]|nr:DegT/DnrJ/EryC1/StrS family aminotransferase [Methanomassiliicoccales archaeon]